jgi:hypothetical protein
VKLTILKLALNATLWACLGALSGVYWGNNNGYSRGMVDALSAVILLREGQIAPEPWTKGRI